MRHQKLVLRLGGGAVLLALTAPAFSLARGPIQINGDSGFTAANGVINPAAAGTALDPYILPNWTINGNGNFCARIQNTTKYFEIRNLNCSNASVGVAFEFVNNGKLRDSMITQIRGAFNGIVSNAGVGVYTSLSNRITISNNTISNVSGLPATSAGNWGGDAIGIGVSPNSDYTVDGNRISQLFGGAGAAGNATNPSGGGGGSVMGIYAPFGMVTAITNLNATGNRFEQLMAGAGGNGAAGTVGVAGGDGGPAGGAFGIRLDGAYMINVNSNTAINLYAGAPGMSGNGGSSGNGRPAGAGGNGGTGGPAIGLWVLGSNVTNRLNTVQYAYASSGANGGIGGLGSGVAGGRGGNGGAGGEAAGAFFGNSTSSRSESNNLNTLVGGNGGSGGRGGSGITGTASGGTGGAGGNGVGLHYQSSPGAINTGNVILNQRGGSGGTGGFVGGANGPAGSSLPILTN